MADTGTTRDRIGGSVESESNRAFLATVALHPYGQMWLYARDIASWLAVTHAYLDIGAIYTCTASFEDPPTWTPPTSHSHTSLFEPPRSSTPNPSAGAGPRDT